jgi:uncharacterized protein YeeX (DUF496 family)
MNSLPTSYKAIEEIQKVIEENSKNLWIVNPLKNCLRYFVIEAEYQEAIEILEYIKEDYPNLLDYKNLINLIKQAEKRYEAL